MILRHAPVVASVVGMDAARGWLPPGAVPPLPEPPIPALLDVRLFVHAGGYHLAWRSHHRVAGTPESATGTRVFGSLSDALEAADVQFGLTENSWLYAGDGTMTSLEVAAIRDAVLTAHDVDVALPFEGLICIPPRMETIDIDRHGTSDIWLILDSQDDGSYVVFYDPVDGGCGLGTSSPDGIGYVGDYGSLWEAVEAL